MAETMLKIFQRHRDCFDFTKEPDWQKSIEARQMCDKRQIERDEVANEYVNGVLAANDFWADDINEDTDELALSFQRITNKAEREAYKKAVKQFLLYIAKRLREHRVKLLNPLTRFRMGRHGAGVIAIENLSLNEAEKEWQRLRKQGFAVYQFPTDIYPAVYTVLGYRPTGARNNAPSGTNAAGRGNDATTPSGTPTGAQEARNNAPSGTNATGRGNDAPAPDKTPTGGTGGTKKPGKRGRRAKEFEDFFIIPGEAATIIPIIAELLEGKIGKDAARIIAACCEGGWMHEPTPASIERKFGIDEAGLKEPLRCHFRYDEAKRIAAPNNPKSKPFTFEEMKPIIERIKAGMEDDKTKPQPPQDAQK